jgi:hypothetical protein
MSIEHQDCGSSRCVYGVDWSSLDVLSRDAYPEPTGQWRIDRSACAISIQRHGPGDKVRECSLTNHSVPPGLPEWIAVKSRRRSRVAIFVWTLS